ncbi:transcriptional regulator [Rhizomicrobium electricum]|jgi:predicted transcriptional regulator|uniref:Transcriptional regulator n=1 Tax=Rhizomicrobium electricum TaxID=480070 RepID=A0ABP3P8Q8_9PROT|nr:transcriptional regulator [Rhizomicrobium electricum]NIJ47598.1 putative transcriptional regulator [Rhizomicrobium electricum]
MNAQARTVVLGVADRREASRRAAQALKSRAPHTFINFASSELLFKLLSTKRREILRALTGAGPLSIREIARRMERDIKAVHGDVTMLLTAGVLQKTEDGLVELPFDVIRVDVVLKAG